MLITQTACSHLGSIFTPVHYMPRNDNHMTPCCLTCRRVTPRYTEACESCARKAEERKAKRVIAEMGKPEIGWLT